ncbi:hypothetical protein TanjilG_15491 [Lupinus angustifolius]|uniref:putative F-box protein PP2-B12 n=1 Tax=Lupinus angustifolius TaxID=3871 RepID=UPI00090D4299|nr:PREDICTED: putative F-box protein PP2-B12 [Lupinus angustifolius]OIV90758.1 hypothetical protein TanjilG_15491 [Lupinus angustifolius]
MEFESLPEGCVATILSRTTPLDTCILSLVSRTFYFASQSDAVWASFLPSDYPSIFSRSISHSSFLATSPSNKSIYLALSQRPIIIDHATKSFHLERKSGKKCYMLAARALTIVWGDTPDYWNWKTLPDSRFPEVAELVDVCWLEIRGVINTNSLSPNTHYAAYFVFKMIDPEGFLRYPVELAVDISGSQSTPKKVCLDPNIDGRHVSSSLQGLQRPNVRSDGWLEIEMGEFFNSGLEDDEVQMSVLETKGGNWKNGLVVEGIEVRPKEAN